MNCTETQHAKLVYVFKNDYPAAARPAFNIITDLSREAQ